MMTCLDEQGGCTHLYHDFVIIVSVIVVELISMMWL